MAEAAHVLRVDLDEETCEREPLPERWRRRYVGGKGLGARYLYEHLSPGVDPLGPENVLLFATGPLTGYLPGEQRYAAITKSPLTGAFLDSYAGGAFPGALAGALEDALLLAVRGRADDPVALVVSDGAVEIEPTMDLWGADVPTTCDAYPDAPVACVGPGGEHRVQYATIASDGGDHHAGRGGAGAVMGAKRLKAVVARGEAPEGLADLRATARERFAATSTGRWLAASETLESVDVANAVGALAARGWHEGRFDGTDDIGIEAAREAASGREHPDDAVPGGFEIETDDGESVPRGAAQLTLGATLGVDDFDAVVALGDRCDRLGLDVISAGNAVAWAVLASREGRVDRDLAFGEAADARALLGEIAARETPLGDALADGVESAAERYGGRELVPTVKGMEAPSYDPRGAAGLALSYATSDRGACHRRSLPVEREPFEGEWTPERAARAVIADQDDSSVLWSLVADDFLGPALPDRGAAWLAAVGAPVPADLGAVGERVWNLTRLFNVREGFDRDDDSMPSVFTAPRADDPADAAGLDPERFEAALDAYYDARGWDDDGHPTEQTLARLDLLDAVDEATPVGRATDQPADR
ncbi:MAG: aldehyde ferredoxin oxidoreductase family protein [Haloarculaceae archaeon]